jgi:hypothetical protein
MVNENSSVGYFIMGLMIGILIMSIFALYINYSWSELAKEQNEGWAKMCGDMNEQWARLCMNRTIFGEFGTMDKFSYLGKEETILMTMR